MKNNKKNLLQKIMAVLLSAALLAGMVMNAVPSRVWAAKEITEFQHGTAYALLNGVYSYEQAVTKLGVGALLQAPTIKTIVRII